MLMGSEDLKDSYHLPDGEWGLKELLPPPC